jgi:hypothetical protein
VELRPSARDDGERHHDGTGGVGRGGRVGRRRCGALRVPTYTPCTVLKAGALVGIVSLADFVRALVARSDPRRDPRPKTDESIRRALLEELESHSWWRPYQSRVEVRDGIVHVSGCSIRRRSRWPLGSLQRRFPACAVLRTHERFRSLREATCEPSARGFRVARFGLAVETHLGLFINRDLAGYGLPVHAVCCFDAAYCLQLSDSRHGSENGTRPPTIGRSPSSLGKTNTALRRVRVGAANRR